MQIDKDSIILYENYIDLYKTDIVIFIRADDGLVVLFRKDGVEFFKSLETISPKDDLYEGQYDAVDRLQEQVTQAFKEFTGYTYDFPNIISGIIFHLLLYMKSVLRED